jgi:hypothetical protein
MSRFILITFALCFFTMDTLSPCPRPLYFGYGAHSGVVLPYLHFVWALDGFLSKSHYIVMNCFMALTHVQVGME